MDNMNEAGYTMAKSGAVALTRSFTTNQNDNPEIKDGIKAMALCPYFANTQLVRDWRNIDSIEQKFKSRVMSVSEVGQKFMDCK